jgi:hypothetical protein
MGRALPERTGHGCPPDWSRAGWHLLRLVAVCAVAGEAGYL